MATSQSQRCIKSNSGDAGPRAYRQLKGNKMLNYDQVVKKSAPYFTTDDYIHTMDLNYNASRLVYAGFSNKCMVVNIEDGKVEREYPEPENRQIIDVKFDNQDCVWFVTKDMELKRLNYYTGNIAFSYKDDKGSDKTIKEINNMIESDELRGHIYVRTSNTKIAEFNPTQNNMVAEFDNLCTEKDSSGQEMFIYFFKVHKRRIFYTESRRQH